MAPVCVRLCLVLMGLAELPKRFFSPHARCQAKRKLKIKLFASFFSRKVPKEQGEYQNIALDEKNGAVDSTMCADE
jgi:hypothetical protein